MLFERVASVEIGPPGKTGFRVEGLRIFFNVEKTDERASNITRVEIANLSAETRGKIREVDHTMILRAGYVESGGEQLLAMGSITHVNHAFEPPNVYSKIEAADGLLERRNTRVSISFAPGVSARHVLTDVARKMGSVVREIGEFTDQPYAQGFSFVGQAQEALDRVTTHLGLTWSYQNGQVQILKKGTTNRSQAPLLSPSTGLVCSPEPMLDCGDGLTKVTKRIGYKVRTLLMPQIEPGQRVVIETRDVQGAFYVKAITHTGDTHGEDWTSDIEATDLKEDTKTKKKPRKKSRSEETELTELDETETEEG